MPERLGIPVHILGQEAHWSRPPQSISDEQVMDALHARMSAQLTREKVKRSFLAENKQRAYLLCALLLIAWSFFIGFNLLYPILAALCVFLSFYSYISEKRKKTTPHASLFTQKAPFLPILPCKKSRTACPGAFCLLVRISVAGFFFTQPL